MQPCLGGVHLSGGAEKGSVHRKVIFLSLNVTHFDCNDFDDNGRLF